MIAPRVISLDLDDTLWPVAPVIAAAEATLLSWLRKYHPRAALGFDVDSMRDMRASVAERFPQKGHDLTFLRRQALAEMFAAAGYREGPAADDAFEIFLSERNRVAFYADVLPALTRLRAKYGFLRSATATPISSAAASPTCSRPRHGVGRRCGQARRADICASAAHCRRAAHRSAARGRRSLADVVGATQAGLQAVWLNRDARTWPEQFAQPARTVTTLADIL